MVSAAAAVSPACTAVSWSGTPAMDVRSWRRNAALAPRLPELLRRVRELERRLAALEGKG